MADQNNAPPPAQPSTASADDANQQPAQNPSAPPGTPAPPNSPGAPTQMRFFQSGQGWADYDPNVPLSQQPMASSWFAGQPAEQPMNYRATFMETATYPLNGFPIPVAFNQQRLQYHVTVVMQPNGTYQIIASLPPQPPPIPQVPLSNALPAVIVTTEPVNTTAPSLPNGYISPTNPYLHYNGFPENRVQSPSSGSPVRNGPHNGEPSTPMHPPTSPPFRTVSPGQENRLGPLTIQIDDDNNQGEPSSPESPLDRTVRAPTPFESPLVNGEPGDMNNRTPQ